MPYNVCVFHIAREDQLTEELQQLMERVTPVKGLLEDISTRNTFRTNRKRLSLVKAFSEYYYHLSLLTNFQVFYILTGTYIYSLYLHLLNGT